jgi:hypothetical protein
MEAVEKVRLHIKVQLVKAVVKVDKLHTHFSQVPGYTLFPVGRKAPH